MVETKKQTGSEMETRNARRDLVVNGTHIRVRSVFNGNIPLEKALGNIAKRKLTAKAKN